ncbi:MAG: flagellar export protein FliJ [Pseudomonadota bacterium]
MSMSSIALLQALLERAEGERDTAAQALRQAEALVAQAAQQAQALHSYRGEYDQRWTARFQQAGTPQLLHCHRGFGQRLDQAIAHQQMNTQHLGNRVQQARSQLLAREQRVAAVRKLIGRRQAELLALANRRDQRSTDEAAQRAASAQRGQHPLAAEAR